MLGVAFHVFLLKKIFMEKFLNKTIPEDQMFKLEHFVVAETRLERRD